MQFDLLTASLLPVIQTQCPVEDKVREVRSLVSAAIKNESFILDSIELLLTSLEAAGIDNWKNPAIYTQPDSLYSIRFILWPAYYCNNPHQHKTWSVTAVIENLINVYTYVWENDIENGVLVRDKQLTARAKEVGFLLPHCIHKLENPSSNVTLTMHVFNHFNQHTSGVDNAIWYPAPEKNNIFENVSKNALSTFSRILVNIHNERSIKLFLKTYELNPPEEQLLLLKSLNQFNSKGYLKNLLEFAPKNIKSNLQLLHSQALA